jgi:maltoporin
VASDLRRHPGRDADIVAHGSRLDESNYVEIELRRDDYWAKTDSTTRLVATLAAAHPVFHYNGVFDAKIAVRNLYLEESGLGVKALSVWAGSRMYRGDDIYLFDWWPLDNLNTVGAGARYEFGKRTSAALSGGLSQPETGFFGQSVARPQPLNQIGSTDVKVLDRQKFTGSLKMTHTLPIGKTGGLRGIAYTEIHETPSGQRQIRPPDDFETLPWEVGYVFGAQIGAFTGQHNTHANLFLRYARGLAAYGDLATPTDLGPDKTTGGAREFLIALEGNWETGFFGLMLGAYIRSFRNASPDLDFNDLDEGIIALRPHLFFGEIGGVALEASYQAIQRGVISIPELGEGDPIPAPTGPHTGHLFRAGIVPFISPAGRGNFSRPHIRLMYLFTVRSDGAQALYPQDDVFSFRPIDHFLGVGAEWWFNSLGYGD